MNNEADKEVEVGDEVNHQGHVDEDEEGPLDRRAFAQDRKKEKQDRDQTLDQDCDMRCAPPRMNPGESGSGNIGPTPQRKRPGRSR